MQFSQPMIERDWLGECVAPTGWDEILESFDLVAAAFGPRWLSERQAAVHGHSSSAVAEIVRRARWIRAAKGCRNPSRLLDGLFTERRSAQAEATALEMMLACGPSIVEYEPLPPLGGSRRRVDFRCAFGGTDVFVEVTRPSKAVAEQQAANVIEQLVTRLDGARTEEFDLLVALSRTPDALETELVGQLVGASSTAGWEELPAGLGWFGRIDRQGVVPQEYLVRPARGGRIVEFGEGARRGALEVCVGYRDHRFAKIFKKAEQLPSGRCGVVAMDVGDILFERAEWRDAIQARMTARIHRRVAAVVLFSHRFTPGVAFGTAMTLIENPHAHVPLPVVVAEGLRSHSRL